MSTMGDLRADFPLYARECLKIAPKKGSLIPFVLNAAQLKVDAVIESRIREGRPPRIVQLKARQRGLSTHAQARIFHRCHLFPSRTGLVIAHKDDSARQLFRMSHRFYRNLPKALRWKKRAENKREIHFDTNDSRMQVETEGEARSYTAQYIHLSEFAFYSEPDRTLDSVMQTVPAQTDSLVIVESTPNGIGNTFYDLWVNAVAGKNDFAPIFLPWFDEQEYRMRSNLTQGDLTIEEKALRETHHLDFEQIEWMRWCIANNCRGELQAFQQEYPSDPRSCFLSSGRPVFEPAAMDLIRTGLEARFGSGEVFQSNFDQKYPPMEIEWDAERSEPRVFPAARGRLRIYAPSVTRHTYCAGWDPSAGDLGSDYSDGAMIDNLTLDLVASWIGKMPPEELAKVARMLGIYFNNAKTNWDAGNHGLAFGITIEDLGYPNLYFRTTTKDSVAMAVTEKLGFLITPKSRDYLIDNARAIVRGIASAEFVARIDDPWLLAQMEGMAYSRKNERGQERAEPRSYRSDDPHFKDDLLFAYCLAIEARKAYPTEPIRPLTLVEKVDVLTEAKSRIVGGQDVHGAIDRLNVTADELMEIDEWASRRARLRAGRQGAL